MKTTVILDRDEFSSTTTAGGSLRIPGPRTVYRKVYRKFGKRIFDIILTLLLLPFIVPVVAVLWIVVRRDGGPGFYSQERVGMRGQTFKFWKLRSMVVNAEQALVDLCASDDAVAKEWSENQKLENDPRITGVGRFIRATGLDELPQILNILKGDMSFVGPRPFMTNQAELYRKAGGRSYFYMRPGVTGPWQISGRGETTFVERIQYDDGYFRGISFLKDGEMILRTFGVMVRKTGS